MLEEIIIWRKKEIRYKFLRKTKKNSTQALLVENHSMQSHLKLSMLQSKKNSLVKMMVCLARWMPTRTTDYKKEDSTKLQSQVTCGKV